MKFASRNQLNYLVCSKVKEKVYRAFIKVDRKLFVPEKFSDLAYLDQAINISETSSISQPSLVIRMIDLLELKGDENVLEIGTGSGYSSAIVSLCCKWVHTIEIDKDLVKKARSRLKNLGFTNISIYEGDGAQGLITEAPFDAILVNAAVKKIPRKLIDQLNDEGKMVIPVEGKFFHSQELFVCQKMSNKLVKTLITPVSFVKLLV